MATTHDVIALISGGKDSLFSLLQCEANGHRVVALANLYPAPAAAAQNAADANPDASDDPDSHMYQTAGHTVVPHYATLLDVPLYRAPIVGSAVDTRLEYHHPAASADSPGPAPPLDETESLLPLLRRVLASHPTATALCTGAVLSTYQRTRIESACARLGLTALSYLWQWPALPPGHRASALLDAMRAAGLAARVVKVASAGLGRGEVWVDVVGAEGRGRVVRGLRRVVGEGGEEQGGAVVGEGGEYETVVVAGPRGRWTGRIEVGEVEKVKGEGDVWWARLGDVRVVEDDRVEGEEPVIVKPTLLDREFEEVLSAVSGNAEVESSTASTEIPQTDAPRATPHFTHSRVGRTVYLSNLHAPLNPSASPSEQLRSILDQLRSLLHEQYAVDPASIVSSTLLLHSMSDFTILNPIYSTLFPLPLPPARVTVSCGSAMPPGCHVLLSTVVDLGPRADRTGLHVQSWSYWAPANIGPYSQAIAVPLPPAPDPDDDEAPDLRAHDPPRIVHMAGQIPLVPASMQLLDHAPHGGADLFLVRAALALQHLFRAGRAVGARAWLAGIAYIAIPPAQGCACARAAAQVWRHAHLAAGRRPGDAEAETEASDDEESSGEVDVWDLQNRPAWVAQMRASETTPVKKSAVVDWRPALPDVGRVRVVGASAGGGDATAPVYVVRVAELPRGADVEWAATGVANGDVVVRWLEVPRVKRKVYLVQVRATGTFMFTAGLGPGEGLSDVEQAVLGADEVRRLWDRCVKRESGAHYTVYTACETSIQSSGVWRSSTQVVPCHAAYDIDGVNVELVIQARIELVAQGQARERG